MRTLRFVGLDDLGARLLLQGDDGERFAVDADERLVAATRRTPSGQADGRNQQRDGRAGRSVETSVDELSPREIQARVRAGESAEALAHAAGDDLERVLRYARPVLQEREHVADTAKLVPIRAGSVEGPLGELVAERLEHVAGDADAIWDSWRRDDGRWTVTLTFRDDVQQRIARWTFDPTTRSVAVEDETARWLTDGAGAPVPTLTAPTAPRVTRSGRRLLSVPDLEPQTQSSDAGSGGYDEDEIADELAALGLQPVADDIDVVVEIVGQVDTETDVVEGIGAVEVVEFDESGEVVIDTQVEFDLPIEPVAEAPVVKPAKKPARRGSKRASVPSWDDIVFGARKPTE